MESAVISGLIGGLVAVVVCTYISKNAKNSKVKGELRFGVFLLIPAWCCLALIGLVAWRLFNDPSWSRPGDLYRVVGLFIGLGAGSAYGFGEYYKVRGKFDDRGIDFYTPWTGRKTESWEDLESAGFNPIANWYTLRFKSGNRIRISGLMSGYGDVLNLLESKGYDP